MHAWGRAEFGGALMPPQQDGHLHTHLASSAQSYSEPFNMESQSRVSGKKSENWTYEFPPNFLRLFNFVTYLLPFSYRWWVCYTQSFPLGNICNILKAKAPVTFCRHRWSPLIAHELLWGIKWHASQGSSRPPGAHLQITQHAHWPLLCYAPFTMYWFMGLGSN